MANKYILDTVMKKTLVFRSAELSQSSLLTESSFLYTSIKHDLMSHAFVYGKKCQNKAFSNM